jgi:hypothetical protein
MRGSTFQITTFIESIVTRKEKAELPLQLFAPVGNGDVLDTVVHKNIRLSNAIVSDILDSDHLPIILYILDHVRTKTISAPLEKFTDWERFQSLTSNLISPRIEINSVAEPDKSARAFAASVASHIGCRSVRSPCRN